MTKERITLGRFGEDLARERLKDCGYRILTTNYRCPLGEIDVIARDDDVLVFVEIKTRKNKSPGRVKEAVNTKKQRQISKVALAYMKSHNLWGSKARFDVVAVGLLDGKNEIEIIKNAFELAY
ncbi:MAG: YraN family protein [Deltaproteobacteria bacterium]|nr:YraN family protein [Deltaproteobacteria bacterium]MCD6264899.1 YraN family protein [Deltaproteobacteria bacterium]RLB16307.1 MAG: YraN family protein [Deltaproteobacteria bacterium]RLB22681.1 MAG: YraN family protein [Deltaproteobacteria bacterium]HDH87178.1 YraN family protein [Desulfobacteraceae bacterium]